MSKKFGDLTQLTTPATNDILPIDDVSAGSTKKILVSDLLSTPSSIKGGTLTTDNTWAWQAFTPAISAGTGSFTSVTAPDCYYFQIGKVVHCAIQINIGTNGTAGVSVTRQLPVAPNLAGGRTFIGAGREDGVTGKMLQFVAKSGSTCNIFDYANNYPGVDSAVIRGHIIYEAA